jgi:hypothetical protein
MRRYSVESFVVMLVAAMNDPLVNEWNVRVDTDSLIYGCDCFRRGSIAPVVIPTLRRRQSCCCGGCCGRLHGVETPDRNNLCIMVSDIRSVKRDYSSSATGDRGESLRVDLAYLYKTVVVSLSVCCVDLLLLIVVVVVIVCKLNRLARSGPNCEILHPTLIMG